ncbi:putative transposase [Lutispora thermophila DSM 19022]|uniref:Putative transposase n=1 Tax=Lutispora thermophila DSM 19022 TaxID=1122184 RepID=A0A1M6IZB7_9FIRM|nr:putative transposase [Lutispora thermophila DSM 19022]
MNEVNYNFPQIQKVKELIKNTKNKRMYQRYHVVFLHLLGHTNKDIANIVDLCQHTVGAYVNTYKAKGIEGLVMGKSTGAPRFLIAEQEKKLIEVITTKTPDEVVIPNRKNWDSVIACQWIKSNFGVEYSARGMLDVLRRLNLSYTRPTYTLAKLTPKNKRS